MGFPVGYPELVVPKPVLHALYLLAWLRSLLFALFSLLDTDAPPPPRRPPTLSAVLIRDSLPVAAFGHLRAPSLTTGCAVCLSEFSEEEEIRCMANCKHIFHRACVDRWIDHDHNTCPLCRTPFMAHEEKFSGTSFFWLGKV